MNIFNKVQSSDANKLGGSFINIGSLASSLTPPAAVLFASDDSAWITGETLVIAGGLR